MEQGLGFGGCLKSSACAPPLKARFDVVRRIIPLAHHSGGVGGITVEAGDGAVLVKTGVGPVGGVVTVGRQLGGLCGRGRLQHYGLTATSLC